MPLNTSLPASAATFAALLSIAFAPAAHTQTAAVATLSVPGRSSSDASIAADGPFVAVAFGAAQASGKDVFVAVSRDGGRQFGAPVRVNSTVGEARVGGELPPRVALVRRAAASASPEIVVVWTARGARTAIKTARSVDGGKSFSPAVALHAPDVAGDRGWPALAVDARGTAHVVWLDHRGLAARPRASAGHHSASGHDGAAMAQGSALFYAAAGGSTPQERELTKGVCYCCKTALVAHDGALYAAWRHVYPGDLRDMAFAASRDGGRSFSTPARISEDRWSVNGCPDDGPALAVGADGTVHAVWPTVITKSGAQQGALFYASSRDGRAFSPRVRVPTLGAGKPSHPQIAVARSGAIAVAWDEVVDGRPTAVVRQLKRDAGGTASFGDPEKLSDAASEYPVLAAGAEGFVAAWSAGGAASRVLVRPLQLR